MTSTNVPGAGETAPTFEEIRVILERVAQRQEEIAREMKETDRRMKETDRQMKETDRRMKETDRQTKETDRRLKKAEDLFTTQWGRLVESLVEGDLVPLLRQRDIDVTETAQRLNAVRNGSHCELDIVARNGAEIVVVEVKTTLRPRDVKRFLDKLRRLADWFPWSEGRPVYGALAYLRTDASVATHAERQGLFVIRATGNSASVLNAPDFEPRVF